MAADLPARAPAPEPAFIGAYDWSGLSVGSNFGGGFGVGASLAGAGGDALAAPNAAWSLPGPDVGGLIGGVQTGYTWQHGPLIYGVEADWQGAGLSGSSRGFGVGAAAPLLLSHQTIDWFGTLRGRVGYAVLPTLVAYGTGGFAYGGGGSRFAVLDAFGKSGEGASQWTRPGFAAGAGLEWGFAPNWSAKLEYLYIDLGHAPGHGFALADANGDPVANAVAVGGAANRLHTLRAGLNYRFAPFPGEAGAGELLRPASDKFHEIETHYIFGFTEGSDVDAEGERELEFITRSDHGRRRATIAADDPDALSKLARGQPAGEYHAIQQSVEFEHTLTQNFQYSLGVTGAFHRVKGVAGLDDSSGANLRGAYGEARYVLLGRGPGSPVGVTLSLEPEWGHVSFASGQSETSFGLETRLAVDTELIDNRLYAGANLLYEPEISRGVFENKWTRESLLGVTGALTYRLTPTIALGPGLQYYRAHADGFSFNTLEGQALYVGPHLHMRLSRKIFMSAAFSAQVSGHASGEAHALDLANFSRYQARLQFGVEF
jgi:opacity protein-like surface antigen